MNASNHALPSIRIGSADCARPEWFNPIIASIRRIAFITLLPARPNPSFEARPNIKTPGPHNGLALFSILRAWGFDAGPASTRTLGITI